MSDFNETQFHSSTDVRSGPIGKIVTASTETSKKTGTGQRKGEKEKWGKKKNKTKTPRDDQQKTKER